MTWKEYDARYPEFTKRRATEVVKVLGSNVVRYLDQDYHHMGSTAIVGMPGKGIIDFTVVSQGLLPDIPSDVISKLKEIGWIYGGIAPHSMDKYADHWFLRMNSVAE